MRTLQTFILRILVDETDPGALRGVLRSVASGEEHPFDNQQNFLDLLRNLCAEIDEDVDTIPGQNEDCTLA